MDDLLHLTVPDRFDGLRLDLVLARLVPDHSRTYLRELIDAGHVTVAGRREPARYLVRAGERVEARLVARARLRPGGDRPPPDLRVVFEDDRLLVVDKPPGMASHPGGADLAGTVAQAAEAHCGHPLPAPGGADRPGIVHRLDKDTSGLMVLAKTAAALADLQSQFHDRTVRKEYRALVFGEPRFVSDWIELGIARDPRHRERMRTVAEGGREAATYYEVVERFAGFALLACRPRTGRTHQVRVHLSAIGHPLVGDRLYRPRSRQGLALPAAAPDPGRHCLHAWALAFRDPGTGQEVAFEAPLPADLDRLRGWLAEHRPQRGRDGG